MKTLVFNHSYSHADMQGTALRAPAAQRARDRARACYRALVVTIHPCAQPHQPEGAPESRAPAAALCMLVSCRETPALNPSRRNA